MGQIVVRFCFVAMMSLVLLSRSATAFSRSSSFAVGGTGTGWLGTSGRYHSYHSTALYMKLQTAIVGLPNVGKSTLFNALTETQGAEAANYPFCKFCRNHHHQIPSFLVQTTLEN